MKHLRIALVLTLALLFVNVSSLSHLRGDGRRLEESSKPLEFLKIGPLEPTSSAAANAVPAGSAPAPSSAAPTEKESAANPAPSVPQVANEGKAVGELVIPPALKESLRSDLPHTFAAMKFLKSGPA